MGYTIADNDFNTFDVSSKGPSSPLIPDQGPLLKTLNVFVLFTVGSEQNFCCLKLKNCFTSVELSNPESSTNWLQLVKSITNKLQYVASVGSG